MKRALAGLIRESAAPQRQARALGLAELAAIKATARPAQTALDGLYVIRTSQGDLSAEDVVRSYKQLTRVESTFRYLTTVDLQVRPIHPGIRSGFSSFQTVLVARGQRLEPVASVGWL